jgi:colicin import membrane protein
VKGEAQEPAALEKRAQPGRLRAIFLAAAVHLAFFALIVFGVTWQSSPTAPVQAELWDKLPPANDKAKPEPPKPEPPKPEPPKPEPPKPQPPKPDVKPAPPKPDAAIAEKAEREKREKEKKQKAERDKQERAEKQKQEDATRKKREQEEAAKKKKEDDKRRVEEDRARKEAEQAREEAASARQKAIAGFVNQIKAKIRGRANVPDTVSGKPSVQVHIRILPGGEVLDIAVTRSSGNRVYDTAIERAIRSASPLPVPAANSELFPQFRDLILNIEHER